MKRILLIGSAFIGLIVGAGFASGQEILQYFTSFGMVGTFAALISTVLFAYVGMMMMWLGSKFKATGHNDVVHKITGSGWFGNTLSWLIDVILILTLLCFGIVMLAGGGSNLEQQFGWPTWAGTTLMAIITFLAGMLRIDAVVKIIGNVTPLLIIFILIIAIFCIFTLDGSLGHLNHLAQGHKPAINNWVVSGINYVSLNVGLGASMTFVMGGNEKNSKIAAIGGLLGGFVLGLMIIVSHLAIFSKIDVVGHLSLPMLGLVNEISPILGFIMAIVVYLMIFNTCLGMFYSLATRFSDAGTSKFKVIFTVTLIIGYIVSFVGFTDLMAILYPIIGYFGVLMILVLIYAPIKMKMNKKRGETEAPAD